MKKYRFEAWGVSDIGTTQEVNQDAFLFKVATAGEQYTAIVAVADGIGGLQGGEIASTLAISQLNLWWETGFRQYYDHPEEMARSLARAIQKMNDDILALSKQKNIQMGTTLDVLLFYKECFTIFHVGDSRVYRLCGGRGKLVQLTKDHSRFVAREEGGKIYGKYLLTSCLGYSDSFECTQSQGAINKNDCFLVCTDGVYKTMPAGRIGRLLAQNKHQMERACGALIEEAKGNGETDNITLVTLRVKR